MARAEEQQFADDYHRRAWRVWRTIIKERPDAILVNEGANHRSTSGAGVIECISAQALDVGTWGVMGIGMGSAIQQQSKPASRARGRGRQRVRIFRMEVETIWLQSAICIVIFNNDASIAHHVQFAGSDLRRRYSVKGSRYDKMMEAFGGVGFNATTPDELKKRAVNAAMESSKPTLINADRPGVRLRNAGSQPNRRASSTRRKQA